MRCRAVLLGSLAGMAFVAGGLTAGGGPAAATDPTPVPVPNGVATPVVSPPSAEQIDDARKALERLRDQRTQRDRTTPAAPALTRVAGPTAAEESRSLASRVKDADWWIVGAGLLVLLVASETTRISVRRAKHRKQA